MVENEHNLSLGNNQKVPPVEEKGFVNQKKERQKKYDEQAVRASESYQAFLEMLNNGETDREQLKSFAYPDRTTSAVSKMFNGALKAIYSQENGEVEKMAAQLLIRDIDRGRVKAGVAYKDPLPGVKEDYFSTYKENYSERKSLRNSELYDFLDQLYVKGMSREQMKAEFFGEPENVRLAPEAKVYMADDEWQKTLKLFLRDLNPAEAEFLSEDEVGSIDSGAKTLEDISKNGKSEKVDMRAKKENPAARILSKILPAQLGSFKKTGELANNNFKLDEKLDQADWTEVSKALVEGLKSVWQDFYYSGRWSYGKENPSDKENKYYLSNSADTDAAASLYFFKKAGLGKALNATALPHGAELPPGVVVDMGYASGIKTKTSDSGEVTLVIDNHQRERGFKTSTALVLFNLFNDSGLFSRQAEAATDPAKKFNPEIGRALAQITVDDDNAGMINNVNQFLASKATLRGLHRTMKIEGIYEFLSSKLTSVPATSEAKDSAKKLWRWNESDYQKVLDTPLTKEELSKYDLAEESARQGQSIFEAKQWFYKKSGPGDKSVKKTDEELIKEGTLVTTEINGKPMRWVVNLIGFNKEKRLRAGHDAVKVNGFDGLISYNPGRMSFMVNTVNDSVDLSKILNLKQGVPVRGAMWVKPLDGAPLEVSLKDILHELAPGYVPQGKVKDYLEKEGLIETTPGKVVEAEKSTGEEPKKKSDETEPVVEANLVSSTEVKSVPVQPVEVDAIPQTEDKEKFVALESVVEPAENFGYFSRELNLNEAKKKTIIDSKVESEQNQNFLKTEAEKYISNHPEFSQLKDEAKDSKKSGIISKWMEQQKLEYYKKYNLPVQEV